MKRDPRWRFQFVVPAVWRSGGTPLSPAVVLAVWGDPPLSSCGPGGLGGPPLSVLLPQDEVDAVVRHAGGEHQARVVVPVQPVQPGRDPGQEAGAPLGLPVGRQRPAARDGLGAQVHHVQEVVVEQQREHLAEAEQGQVGRVLGLDHPGEGEPSRG